MENKSIKKSTIQQLQLLVKHMEDNPEFARGIPVFGSSKFSAEEEWKTISQKLNSVGPPTRSIAEWKKTWADLKSRTKKKIAANQKSLKETGGGLYRFNCLTDLEEAVDRTLLLSSAAAPTGKVFGVNTDDIDECFINLLESPPKPEKVVAVVTPTRQGKEISKSLNEDVTPQQLTKSSQKYHEEIKEKQKRVFIENYDEPCCSSTKKKPANSEQINLIRRQLRVAEQTADVSKQKADALKRLADAVELQTESSKRIAIAAESQAESIKLMLETALRVEKMLEIFLQKK